MTAARAAAAVTATAAGADDPRRPAAEGAAGRWELLRALGALSFADPADGAGPAGSLGLRTWTRAEHTQAFVLSLPPYASIYLGREGKLGGEGADRVAGVWRALGLTPPSDADHLAAILALYAELGEASESAATRPARERLTHLRSAVLWEHLRPWVPVYLDAIGRDPAFASWAELTGRALRREARLSRRADDLPLALRSAPPGVSADSGYDDLLDALTAPLRAGFILTYDDLSLAAAQAGTGLRRGERRFALAAMLDQDAAETLAWLGRHAQDWAGRHARRVAAGGGPRDGRDPDLWWERRASGSAAALAALADRAARAS